jgi:hypothetical protein
MDSDLVAALRSRGVTVITPHDAGLTARPDEEQLAFATAQGCVVDTFNVSDFYRLHRQWMSAGQEHAGMILAPQQRFSVGEQLRRILPPPPLSAVRARAWSLGRLKAVRRRIQLSGTAAFCPQPPPLCANVPACLYKYLSDYRQTGRHAECQPTDPAVVEALRVTYNLRRARLTHAGTAIAGPLTSPIMAGIACSR